MRHHSSPDDSRLVEDKQPLHDSQAVSVIQLGCQLQNELGAIHQTGTGELGRRGCRQGWREAVTLEQDGRHRVLCARSRPRRTRCTSISGTSDMHREYMRAHQTFLVNVSQKVYN